MPLRGGLAAALALLLGAQPPAAQEAEPGAYLAGRAAARAADFAAASDLLPLALAGDPANPVLLESALTADLGLGRFEAAETTADRLVGAGHQSQLAHLVRAAGAGRRGDWRALLAELEAGRGVGALVDGLSRGWAQLGRGEAEAAALAFDEVAGTEGLRGFGLYHKALALASSGDLAGAEAILALPDSQGMARTRRVVLAHAEVLGALGRPADAVTVIDAVLGRDLDAPLAALRARLEAGEPVSFTLVESPAEGLAEVYFAVAGALAAEEEDGGSAALMYAHAALALDPGHADAALLAAQRLDALGRPDLADGAYALVPAADPAFVAAEIGRAASLRRAGEAEAAADVLGRLAQGHPDLPEVHTAHGDALRALSRPVEAEAAYGRAIDLHAEDDGRLWWVHYARAIAREARGDWPGAEADLRRALELRPGQPRVLNHLGYGLVDRGEALPEALALIEEAVAADPESGAIVDSLGWAHFRLGRYGEAVAELERAVTLEPADAVVNDHLGDAYWMVGRTREARFQWTRALSFGPEEAEAGRIRRKLAEGLDAVLATEPAPETATGTAPGTAPETAPEGAAAADPGEELGG